MSETLTNLDIVVGRVDLNLQSEESLANIEIKMEGVSKTTLRVQKRRGNRTKTKIVSESHKLLYVTEILFPPEDIRKLDAGGTGRDGFTLAPGRYQYPFEFRIPINNDCTDKKNFIAKLTESGEAQTHITTTLPPSCTDTELATIKYFFKVTVKKSAFYKMNMREYLPFIFLPIEPPRPAPGEIETFYARRKHRFPYTAVSRSHLGLRSGAGSSPAAGNGQAKKKRGFFASMMGGGSTPREGKDFINQQGPEFYLEARMPEPRIIVPSEPIDLRLLVSSQTHLDVEMYMHSLAVTLIITTTARVGAESQTSVLSLPVVNLQNLKLPFGAMTNPQPGMYEAEFDQRKITHGLFLPNTVPPTFKICNVERSYALEVIVELSHGQRGTHELIQLGFPVQVWSGIRPPPALLQAVQNEMQNPYTKATSSLHKQTSAVVDEMPDYGPPQLNKRPTTASSSTPGSTGAAGASSLPTYNEAVGSRLQPIEGPRRTYEQAPAYFSNVDELDNEKN
ncbi:hypothetical protein BZA70DRAFT_289444 [Myxozyma melibiosi]|uniref:Arrestin-like N-terminal domain-containing protein n=1 Tax=Myxozyma melibiosi TaxID=54550 RepID=A0ABR1F6Q5_9ASCO